MLYAPGFSSLSLPPTVLKGIHFMGYKEPTPIQKAAISPLIEGRDVVAMARTGSGKTAAFVIPLMIKFNCLHSARVGARAIILAPTRELAAQTNVFIEGLCKKAGSSLRTACILGGDSISEQFSILMTNPDILIGTPGRLLHLLAEVSTSSSKEENLLGAVQYVVLDEADRLFEDPTSAAQISLLFSRLHPARQVALFSATLPTQLLAFSKTGLKDPLSIRLDADSRLSENLKIAEKPAMLLKLVEDRNPLFFSNDDSGPGGMIFVATRHIADFLSEILTSANIKHGVLFGQMDPEARKIVIGNFRTGQLPLLVVTDVASRGIDIPSLKFIINYDFPSTPKLFVHRAGRVARAGRSGTAISFVSMDERPFLMELQSFQGLTQLQFCRLTPLGDPNLGEISARIESYMSINVELGILSHTAYQSLLKYQRTRPKASPAAYVKAKTLPNREMIPIFEADKAAISEGAKFMMQLASFRPSETVFESMRKASKGQRALISAPGLDSIAAIRSRKQTLNTRSIHLLSSDDTFIDEKSFMSYQKTSNNLEKGLEVAFTLPVDENHISKKRKLIRKWDPKRKRFVRREAQVSQEEVLEKTFFSQSKASGKMKDRKLEVGQLYRNWKKTTHQQIPRVGSIEFSKSQNTRIEKKPVGYRRKKSNEASSLMKSYSKSESKLKNNDQIIKARAKKAAIAERLTTKRPSKAKLSNK